MDRTTIVPLGGFLGAGKTTLILAASRVLAAQDRRCAAILNDQGTDLVDTQLVQSHGVTSDQVAGGCFCCRFSELIEAAHRLLAYEPYVIFAEAVGSCTDISATTLQPLKLEFGDRFTVAPYTVLVDPQRAREMKDPDADPNLEFLFRKQLDEADLICLTKTDLYNEFPDWDSAPLRYVSAATGQGVAEWLTEILGDSMHAGTRLLDIDYERYARAEAALAWLNCSAIIHPEPALSPPMLVGPLLEQLDESLTR